MAIKITKIEYKKEMRKDSMPDVDLDFPSAHRHEVKEYFEKTYGHDHVVSVGTYNRIKPKSAIKGFMKAEGLPFTYVNMVTNQIADRLKYKWSDILTDAMSNRLLRDWIDKYPEAVESMKPIMNQAAIASVHASASIITPKFDKKGRPMTVFDWMPVRKVFESKTNSWILVSEWEGKYIDKAGFLKEDILGLSQLDKFMFMMKEIKKHRGEKIVLNEIPLDQIEVYDLFSSGFNEDVFQFNSAGLKKFSKQVRPDGMEDLIAMSALYRPGPMSSNAHTDYALIKHGRKKPEFDYGLKDVTKKTHGLYIYQEQIMQAVHILGGLSLSDAEAVRTVMKKFDKDLMKKYKGQFVEGAAKNGCKSIKAEQIWDKLERFSGYGFNRSHSAAYSLISYWSQWFKANYPEEFYACALHFAQGKQYSEFEVSSIIDEIETRGIKLKLSPPDINSSLKHFNVNIKRNTVYWSLTGIKGIGDKIVDKILEERNLGEFKSLDDFYNRMRDKKVGVGKGVAEKLIKAGAFDTLSGVREVKDRLMVIEYLYKELDNSYSEFNEKYSNSEDLKRNVTWSYIQKELTGYGKIDYRSILEKLDVHASKLYLNATEFLEIDEKWKKACVAGKIIHIKERPSKRGKFATITIESNDKQLVLTLWNDVWEERKDEIMDMKKRGKLFAMIGKILEDDYRGHNVLYSDEKITKIFEI